MFEWTNLYCFKASAAEGEFDDGGSIVYVGSVFIGVWYCCTVGVGDGRDVTSEEVVPSCCALVVGGRAALSWSMINDKSIL